MDHESDEDGVRTGEYHVAPTSGWAPASTEPPIEAEHLVADAPGSSNHDRRHARRSDDESRAFRLDGAV